MTPEDYSENSFNEEYRSKINVRQEENTAHSNTSVIDVEEKANVCVRAQRQRGLRRRSAMIDWMEPSNDSGDVSQTSSSPEDTDDFRREKTRAVESETAIAAPTIESVESKIDEATKEHAASVETIDVTCEKIPETTSNPRRNRRHNGRGAISDGRSES